MSMKLAFSDFDGTLCIDEQVAASDIAAIRAWQAAGNKFGIATGRGYRLIAPELERYHIPVDFLVCANGAAVYTAQGDLQLAHTIPAEDARALLSSAHVTNYQGGMLFFTTTDACSYRSSQMLPPEYFRPLPDLAAAAALPELLQIGMEFTTQAEALQFAAAIEAAFPQQFTGNINRRFLDINVYGTAKDQGILALAATLQVPKTNIWAIGDDRNDLPMLHRFGPHGCCVARARAEIRQAAGKVYASVGEMLRDNL